MVAAMQTRGLRRRVVRTKKKVTERAIYAFLTGSVEIKRR